MKRNVRSVFTLAIISMALIGVSSCGDKKEEVSKPAAKTATTAKGTLPNYRYIDADTVLAHYNLAKDFEEQNLRLQNDLQSEAKRHENSLRSSQNSIQQKLQNNQYTEQTYKQAMQQYQQQEQNAAQALSQKEQAMQKAAMEAQKTLNDSIEKFIAEYNRSHGYDAIFFKGATVYIDPRLDITAEVIEGLNARYNKVKK